MVRRLCHLKQIYGVMYLVSRHRCVRCFDGSIIIYFFYFVNRKNYIFYFSASCTSYFIHSNEKWCNNMFWEKFVELCAEKNKYPNNVCKELQFSNATATHWKQGAKPNATTLKKVADYFGVPVEYFRQEKKPSLWEGVEMSESQIRLIKRIASLSEEEAVKIEKVLEAILKSPENR